MTEATPLASEQITVPAGWKLVPEKLTAEMCFAYDDCPYEGAEDKWRSLLSASPAPSGQGVSGEVDTDRLQKIAAGIETQADCLEGYAEQMGYSGKAPASVFHWQATHFRDLAAPAPSCAPGEVERAKVLWKRACVGREGYCSSDLQDAAIEAIKQAFREAEAAARSATLPAHFQWSESNREKFDFGRDSAADAIAALSPQRLDAKEGGE